MIMTLEKEYNPKKVEEDWQRFWRSQSIYRFTLPKDKKDKVFAIDTPPPYASAGHLHVGHGLHYTQIDIVARYKRLKGFKVYYPPCFDNNGLPTEKYVEEKFNISKNKVSRQEFRELCLKESHKLEKAYANNVFRALGHSFDWDLLYTTIDPKSQKVAQASFIDLYKKGLVYRAEQPVFWCPYHQTALAQAELEQKQRTTTLYYIKFKNNTKNNTKKKDLLIATTRPEFLPACVAVFVHPEDERYKHLIGDKAIVPLFDYEVPIMADELVDKDFGTGIVMVCTFGDKTDVMWWKKHKLPLKSILNKDGTLNNNAGFLKGLSINKARIKVVELLKEKSLIEKQEQIQQSVSTCWRCGTPIEFIITKQWFIKVLDFKDELIKQGKKIRWFPSFFFDRYKNWVSGLQWDWCISRQRLYGVPIPVWYCKKCGKPLIPKIENLPVDPVANKPKAKCSCGSQEFIPERDVFDTWMTSSMTPQIACKWLENSNIYKRLFPMQLRPQSHDIIRTWAFYTIAKSWLHFKSIPWENIAIGTFVLDEKGKGMHKSKGNVVWVDDLLKRYSVDNFRYWVGTANWGEDLPFKEGELIAGKRFLTKLWNAARFVSLMLEDYKPRLKQRLDQDKNVIKVTEIMDEWILTKLSKIEQEASQLMDNYRFGEALKRIETFFWNDFCDNYLEIIKDRLYNPDNRGLKAKLSAQKTLHITLYSFIRMLSPIMPHITEHIYQNMFRKFEGIKSIHLTKWPETRFKKEDSLRIGDEVINIISKVRKGKNIKHKSLKAKARIWLPKQVLERIKPALKDLKAVTNSDIFEGQERIDIKD